MLYEQGVLSKDDGSYEALASGSMTAYDFMINKIYTLEIEPAQLALEPCSASAVITDVKTGDVLACVSYPGYDNNRLVNNMDTDYYANYLQINPVRFSIKQPSRQQHRVLHLRFCLQLPECLKE